MFEQIGVIFVQVCAGRETIAELPSNQRIFFCGFLISTCLPRSMHVGTSNDYRQAGEWRNQTVFFQEIGHTVSWYQFASPNISTWYFVLQGYQFPISWFCCIMLPPRVQIYHFSLRQTLFFDLSIFLQVRDKHGPFICFMRASTSSLSPFAASTSSFKFGKHLPALFFWESAVVHSYNGILCQYAAVDSSKAYLPNKLKETIKSSSTTTTKFEKSNIFCAQCKHAQTSVLIIYGE